MNNVGLILILEVILLVCGGAFLRQKNPAGFNRVVDDVEQLVSSAISNSGTAAPATAPEVPAPASTANVAPRPAGPAPVVAPTPAYVPAPGAPTTAPAPVAPTTQWTPPAVLPSQPNWTWTTIAGQVYHNVRVLSVDPQSVMIMYDGGGERVPLAYLPPDLQKLFNYTPTTMAAAAAQAPAGGATAAAADAPPAATAPTSPSISAGAGATSLSSPPATLSPAIANLVGDNLVRFSNNSLQPVSDSVLAPVRYLAIYYSAQWCPPCHAFTPKLVQFYNSFKPAHPNFDLVFVSDDSDADHMEDYMREMAMPWLAISYNQLDHSNLAKKSGIQSFANSGIPDLVLIDSTGKVLADSFQGDNYLGPESVVADIQSMVK